MVQFVTGMKHKRCNTFPKVS
ncbi:MAG: hypothetical protein R2765_02770 [Ferruginibacter sp.]